RRPLAAAARGGGRDRAGARPRGGRRSHAARRGRGARGVVARSPGAVGTGAARGAVRIAFFFRRLAGPGGAERTMYEEALYCRRHGIETALYTFGLDPSALFDPPYPVEVKQLGAIPRQAGLVRRLLVEARNIRLLRRALRRFAPDVVLWSSGGTAARRSPSRGRCRRRCCSTAPGATSSGPSASTAGASCST